MNATDNPILRADSYKSSHFKAYPDDIRFVSSYVESRGGAFNRTVFFGLQMYLRQLVARPITEADIDEAEAVLTQHGLPFNRAGWTIIAREHGGHLPLLIKAVPEGTVVNTSNVLVTVENTDARLPWLTSYVETALLRAIWYPTTVATLSWHIKQDIRRALDESCDDPDAVLPFRLHDFGARGVSSGESAGIGGAAHLVNFMGSDTLEGIMAVRRHYGEPMAGFSIPASEHSVITSFGRDGETAAYEKMLDAYAGPGKLLAVVSDTYDLWNAIRTIWGGTLKHRVVSTGGTLVIRPDSGDPTIVPVQAVAMLADIFGTRTNRKGYRVLPDFIRVIQGDGINRASINTILAALMAQGFSAENIAFGMGGALLQGVNRDTLRFAMKASAVRTAAGGWTPISKDPATDPGKRSKAGRLALVAIGGRQFATMRLEGHEWEDSLGTVYRDGQRPADQTFAEIRARADAGAALA